MTEMTNDDRLSGFLQPDVVLPTQFFQSLRMKGQFDGERRLMIAVLEDAVNCFMKQLHATDPKARQLYLDAEAWITASDRAWFFAFENICDTLDLDPEYLREGLFKWRAAERRRVAATAASEPTTTDDDVDGDVTAEGEQRTLRTASGR